MEKTETNAQRACINFSMFTKSLKGCVTNKASHSGSRRDQLPTVWLKTHIISPSLAYPGTPAQQQEGLYKYLKRQRQLYHCWFFFLSAPSSYQNFSSFSPNVTLFALSAFTVINIHQAALQLLCSDPMPVRPVLSSSHKIAVTHSWIWKKMSFIEVTETFPPTRWRTISSSQGRVLGDHGQGKAQALWDSWLCNCEASQ